MLSQDEYHTYMTFNGISTLSLMPRLLSLNNTDFVCHNRFFFYLWKSCRNIHINCTVKVAKILQQKGKRNKKINGHTKEKINIKASKIKRKAELSSIPNISTNNNSLQIKSKEISKITRENYKLKKNLSQKLTT